MPFTLAASTAASPAGCMRPADSSLASRCLFDFDHTLVGRRGVNRIALRCSSRVCTVLSIQPKIRQTSTMSSYAMAGRPVTDRHCTSQNPGSSR